MKKGIEAVKRAGRGGKSEREEGTIRTRRNHPPSISSKHSIPAPMPPLINRRIREAARVLGVVETGAPGGRGFGGGHEGDAWEGAAVAAWRGGGGGCGSAGLGQGRGAIRGAGGVHGSHAEVEGWSCGGLGCLSRLSEG